MIRRMIGTAALFAASAFAQEDGTLVVDYAGGSPLRIELHRANS